MKRRRIIAPGVSFSSHQLSDFPIQRGGEFLVAGEWPLRPSAPDVLQPLRQCTVNGAPFGWRVFGVGGRRLRNDVDHNAGNSEFNLIAVSQACQAAYAGRHNQPRFVVDDDGHIFSVADWRRSSKSPTNFLVVGDVGKTEGRKTG